MGKMTLASTRPRILFFNAVNHAVAAFNALKESTSPELITSKSRSEFFTDCQNKYRDVAAIYRTSASGAVAGNFDEELIQNLPSSLKFICHNGAGYDQIDVKACTRRGITVTYAPDPVTGATADLACFLLLGALRQLNPALSSLRRGDFKNHVAFGHDPKGKVLGILGMGRIGRALMNRMEPFGMKFVYHNRKPVDDAGIAKFVSLPELLRQSDVISVHVPLNDKTRHLIDEQAIKEMKPGVVIVNTARGAIIDEAAMADALDSGHIAAVGLDVYEQEPAVHPKLLANSRALLVPHLGTHTFETLAEMEALAMENARRGVLGEILLTVVPEQRQL